MKKSLVGSALLLFSSSFVSADCPTVQDVERVVMESISYEDFVEKVEEELETDVEQVMSSGNFHKNQWSKFQNGISEGNLVLIDPIKWPGARCHYFAQGQPGYLNIILAKQTIKENI